MRRALYHPLAWFLGGAAYGLLAAIRLELLEPAWAPLVVMACTGFAFLVPALLALLGRLALHTLARRLGRTSTTFATSGLSPSASLVASLGSLALFWTVLFVVGDLVVSLAYRHESPGALLAARSLGALGAGALAWWLARRAALRAPRDGLPRARAIALGVGVLGLVAFGAARITAPPLPPPRPTVPAPPELAIRDTGLRVLLIGLDAATWKVVTPMAVAGELPAIASLEARGATSTVHAPPPRLSPVNWTTILTGRPEQEHGIHDYVHVALPGVPSFPFENMLRDRALLPFAFATLGEQQLGLAVGNPPPSTAVRTRALPHMLAAGNRSSLVLGMPCTWPVEPLPGLVVSNRYMPGEFDTFGHEGPPPGRLHPPDAEASLSALRVDSGGDPAPMLRKLGIVDDASIAELATWRYTRLNHLPMRLMADIHDSDETCFDVLEARWPSGEFGFGAALVNGIDVFTHAFWEERYPEEFGHPKSQHPEWGKLIGAYHRLVDARLGALLARLDPRTVVFVLSDHGMEASPGNLVWPGWHSEEGIFMAAGAPIRRGARVERVDFLDVAPTVLHLLGYPVPRDLKGRVLEEILEPEFLARFPVRSIASYE